MSLLKTTDDEWTSTGVKSSFKIVVPEKSSSSTSEPSSSLCGLGWRFSCTIDSRTAPIVMGSDGALLQGRVITVHFDPHLIRSAAYGRLSFTVTVLHLLIDSEATRHTEFTVPDRSGNSKPRTIVIGTYIYSTGTLSLPVIAITVEFPANLELDLPRSLHPRLQETLADDLLGNDGVDIKFYAFSRKGTGHVADPRPMYAKTALLSGYSEFLDLLISGDGFAESKIVDLDRHVMCEGTADSEEYGYMSDSDLDPESDDEDVSGFPTSAPNVPLPPSRPPSPEPRRMGRVVILRDTAFNTWNALLYYLYTHKIRFTAGPRLRNLSVRSKIPECSPKSMYRLADKLGLDDLKARSLSSIKACLSRENIVREAFASFTSMYPEVQDITVEFLIKNFAEVTPELYRVLKCICDEERPHCYDVLRKIVAGRNENKRGPAGVQGAANEAASSLSSDDGY